MKNIEAINHIKDIRETIRAEHMCKSIDGECTKEDIVIYKKQIHALNLAMRKIKKDIPGFWIEGYSDDVIKCPKCRKEFNILDNDTEAFNYCPACGKRLE